MRSRVHVAPDASGQAREARQASAGGSAGVRWHSVLLVGLIFFVAVFAEDIMVMRLVVRRTLLRKSEDNALLEVERRPLLRAYGEPREAEGEDVDADVVPAMGDVAALADSPRPPLPPTDPVRKHRRDGPAPEPEPTLKKPVDGAARAAPSVDVPSDEAIAAASKAGGSAGDAASDVVAGDVSTEYALPKEPNWDNPERLYDLCVDDVETGTMSACHGSATCVTTRLRERGGEKKNLTLMNASHTEHTFDVDVPPSRKIIFDMSSNDWSQVGWGNNAESISRLLTTASALRRRLKLIYSGCYPEGKTQIDTATGEKIMTRPSPCVFDPSLYWQYVDGTKWGFTEEDAKVPTLRGAKHIDEEYITKKLFRNENWRVAIHGPGTMQGVKNATALAAFQEIFWRHVRSLDDDVVRISFEKTGGMPFMFGYNNSPIHSWTSDSIAFKRYVDYMSFDLQPWFAEKYDDLFSKTEDYVAVHVRTIAADVGFDSSAAAPFDLDVTLRVLGWDAEKTAKAVRADVLGVCSWENDVYVASSSGMVIELFKTLCPNNRIFHLPLNHKGVAGHVANHLAKREAVDDTMAEWTLLSRASRVVVFLGSSSFSNSATSRGCGPPIETVSRASKRMLDLLAKMKYRVNDPKHIDHALWDNATTFRDTTRDTPCEDLENSRACYARLVMVYGSPDS